MAEARRSPGLLWSGVGAVVLGVVLLLYGAAPLAAIGDLMGGGDPDQVQATMDRMMAEAKGRVWADVAGFVLLLVGLVLLPMSKPKPRSVEELVEEKVAARLAGLAPASVAPVAAAGRADPAPASPPPSPEGGGMRRCVACGGVLVAGGRICPAGHPQAA